MWRTVYGFTIVSLVVCFPAAALSIRLPAQVALKVDSVVLELWNADVDVYVDPAAEPFIRARSVDGEPRLADLAVSSVGRILTVSRGTGDAAEPFRIRIEITASSTQQVSVHGRDLAVTVRDARSPEDLEKEDEELEENDEDENADEEEDEDGEGVEEDEDGEDEKEDEDREDEGDGESPSIHPILSIDPAALRLVLEDSSVELTGVRNGVVVAHRTSLWLTRTQGSFDLDLEYGTAEVRGHQGNLQMEATESEVTVHDLRGSLEPRMTGGSLDLRQGTGSFAGTFTGSVLLLDGWQGYVRLQGTGTTIEARGAERATPWTLEGQDLLVSLDAIAGPVTAQLNGGQLEASTMSGRLMVTVTNRVDVELQNLMSSAELKVSDGSTVRLVGASAGVRAEVHDAELRAERIAILFVSGERSRIEASEISRLSGLQMTDSDVDLDLTTIAADPSLKLMGNGRATVRLAAPCIVRLAGPAAPTGSTADVLGCDLRLQGQPGREAGGPLIHGDRRPVTLTVTFDEGVELAVEGLP